MKDPVLNWECERGIMVSAQRAGVPSEETWGRFVQNLREGRVTAMMTVASGKAKLLATQRTDIIEHTKNAEVLIVVLDTTVSRAMTTALSWFLKKVEVFSPAEMDQAIAALRLSAKETRWVSGAVERITTPALLAEGQ